MKNFLQKIKDKFTKKNVETPSTINPHKHWMIALKMFFVLILLLTAFSLYILYQIKNEQVFQAKPATQDNSKQLKEDLLKKVTETFDKKAKKVSEVKSNSIIFKDPSL